MARLALVAIAAVFVFGPVSLVQAVKPGVNGKIAFTSDGPGNNEIYTMNSDTSGLTRLTDNTVSDSDPTWSPYDTSLARIAYVSNPGGNTDIYAMDAADGANRTRLTTDSGTDWEPSWSPDGTRIAFVSDRFFLSRIFLIDADGSNETQLTSGNMGNDREPAWSPDGTKIAFASDRESGDYEIYEINTDGSHLTRLTTSAGQDRQPTWSPDGTKIAFTSYRDGNGEIYTVAVADPANQTRLTNLPLSTEQDPAWSPDGTRILVATDATGSFEVGVMDSDGGNATTLTNAPSSVEVQPDGQPERVPDTTITSGPSSLTSSTQATFTFTSDESGVSFYCSLDGGSFTLCTSPATLTGLSDGSHTVQIAAQDIANYSDQTPATHPWTVDTTPPETTITSGPAQSSNTRQATFAFSSNETGSTFECRSDSGDWSSCSSGQTVDVTTDGSHTYEVRATDQAGNTDATPASFSWSVDTVAPDTFIDSGPEEHTRSISANLSFHASESGVAYECSVDGEGFAPCFSPEPVSGLGAGDHTFQVRATDGAGNTDASPATYTWTVDRRNPDVSVSLGTKTSKGKVLKIKRSKLKRFSGTASDTAGIRRVKVALRISRKVHAADDRCRYISLKTGFRILHKCRRNYTKVSGTTSWSVTVRNRAQRRLRTNEEYVLYVRATDQAGNNKYSRTRFMVVEG